MLSHLSKEEQNRNHNIINSLPGCPDMKWNSSPTIPRVPFCKENAKPHMNKAQEVKCFDDEWGWGALTEH